jgi:hypothetical protein
MPVGTGVMGWGGGAPVALAGVNCCIGAASAWGAASPRTKGTAGISEAAAVAAAEENRTCPPGPIIVGGACLRGGRPPFDCKQLPTSGKRNNTWSQWCEKTAQTITVKNTTR